MIKKYNTKLIYISLLQILKMVKGNKIKVQSAKRKKTSSKCKAQESDLNVQVSVLDDIEPLSRANSLELIWLIPLGNLLELTDPDKNNNGLNRTNSTDSNGSIGSIWSNLSYVPDNNELDRINSNDSIISFIYNYK